MHGSQGRGDRAALAAVRILPLSLRGRARLQVAAHRLGAEEVSPGFARHADCNGWRRHAQKWVAFDTENTCTIVAGPGPRTGADG